MSVSLAAALVGSYGLQAVIDDNVAIYITDNTPNAESRYRARFYLDPNSIPMLSGEDFYLLYGLSGSAPVARVKLIWASGSYQLMVSVLSDSATWTSSGTYNISDAQHFIEVDWQAASGAGANNGSLTLWVDGVQRTSLTGVDNDTHRIDVVRLGAVAGLETGTRGTIYLDAFESRRLTYVGP